jgi:hypothetical protein
MLFRWRVEFGLTARKAPQLATGMLADGATNDCRRSLRCALWCGRRTE